MIPVKQLQQSSPAHPRRFAKGHKIYSYKQIFADFRPLLQLVISVCDRPCVLWQLHRCLQELRCSDVPSMKATERCFGAGQHAFLKQCGWAAVNFSLQLPLLKTTLKHWLSRWHSFLPNSVDLFSLVWAEWDLRCYFACENTVAGTDSWASRATAPQRKHPHSGTQSPYILQW